MRKTMMTWALCAALTGVAAAEEISFEFSGEVREVTGPLPAPFENVQVGDAYTLLVTFESETVDDDPDPNAGLFAAVTGYELRVGEAVATGPLLFNYIFTFVDLQQWVTLLSDFTGLTMAAAVEFAPGTFKTDDLPEALDFEFSVFTLFQFGGEEGFADCSITGYRKIGGLECGAIRKLKVKCNNGKLTAKVKSSLPEGTPLTLDNGGDQRLAVVNAGGKAKARWKGQAGERTVAVVECPEQSGVADCG